jgi:predicted ATPase/class 3 adenylate cyclase
MVGAPTGTVTFLFTDIEGSTKLAREHPKMWETARSRHHAILREAIECYHGYVFQIIGDAFCAAFHTAGDALQAAAKAQTDLHLEPWGEVLIKVRMGIHTGKAEVQENGEYHGYLAMSRVQRLMSAGHGGQVLISAASQELLLEDMPDNASLRDLRERRLKDLIRPEHVYQLVIAGLPVDFPALKTLDLYRQNLPVQLTSFIGREKQMEEIQQAISTHRLVTLTGVGGTGKTRLSLQVAAELLDQFRDGVWFVELASISDPNLVAQAIFSCLGIPEKPGMTILQLLLDFLRAKTLLLVVDNCEHLIAACAELVETLLMNAPSLKILATSREPLSVSGEMIWHVPSLSLPDSKPVLAMERLSQYEAVQLFIERALLVQPHFQITSGNAPAVAEICFRLDGIPLAIELAAARVKGLSVEQITARLDDRFHLLTGGSRTVLPRQQTLQATIDWSYMLLSDEESRLFQRLSVFAGGWTLEAAEQVCAGETLASARVLDLLLQLVDKSLVVAKTQGLDPRYYMLESIRKYAQEKLIETGESNLVRDRHLEYFRGLAEKAKPHFRDAQQLKWMKKIEIELDNVRAALTWSLQGGSGEDGLSLGADLGTDVGAFWFSHAHTKEGYEFLEQLILHASTTSRPDILAAANFSTATLGWWLGELARARQYAEQSELLWLQLGQLYKVKAAEARFLKVFLTKHLNRSYDPIQLRQEYQEVLQVFEEAGDHWMTAHVLYNIAFELDNSGDLIEARRVLNQSMTLFRQCGDLIRISKNNLELAQIAIKEDNYGEARVLCEEALSVFSQLPFDMTDEPLWMLGAIALHERDYPRAKAYYTGCLLFDRQINFYKQFAECMLGFAAVSCEGQFFERAARLVGAAEHDVRVRQVPLEDFDRVELQQLELALREALGVETFERFVVEGSNMTTEEAVIFALEERNE